jgi:hypothetical protein
MKTKVLFSRYPRKISLLKDLRRGYPRAFLLRKSLKTRSELEIPSKISLLKGLSGALSRGKVRVLAELDAPRGTLQIVKEPEPLTAVIEQLMCFLICYPNRNAGSSSKKRWIGRGDGSVGNSLHERFRQPSGMSGASARPLQKTVQSHDMLYKTSRDILYTPALVPPAGREQGWRGRRWM